MHSTWPRLEKTKAHNSKSLTSQHPRLCNSPPQMGGRGPIYNNGERRLSLSKITFANQVYEFLGFVIYIFQENHFFASHICEGQKENETYSIGEIGRAFTWVSTVKCIYMSEFELAKIRGVSSQCQMLIMATRGGKKVPINNLQMISSREQGRNYKK